MVLRAVLFDPGFSIEANYYAKAVDWDSRQRQQQQRKQLGWQLQLRTWSQAGRTQLEIQLQDRTGAELPNVNLSVEAFANARSQLRISQPLVAVGQGHYQTLLTPTSSGLWEMRFRVQAEGVDYVQTVRRDLARNSPGRPFVPKPRVPVAKPVAKTSAPSKP